MYPSPVKIYIHAIKFRYFKTLSTLVLKICRGRFNKTENFFSIIWTLFSSFLK